MIEKTWIVLPDNTILNISEILVIGPVIEGGKINNYKTGFKIFFQCGASIVIQRHARSEVETLRNKILSLLYEKDEYTPITITID